MRTELIDEFIVFAQVMNFSKAASRLNLTQPNLSKHMMELESELGVKLIDRESHGKLHPVLTYAGRHFLEEASVWRNQFEDIVRECREMEREAPQVLRLQEVQSIRFMAKLYPFVEGYTSAHPKVSSLFMNLEQIHPTDALDENKFDIVVRVCFGDTSHAEGRLQNEGFAYIPFMEGSSVLWFQKGNPNLEQESQPTLEELARIPIIEIRGKNYDYIAEAYRERCELEGIRPLIRYKQYLESTVTSLFLSNFRDGAILSSSSFLNDPRLQFRQDLEHIVLEDPRTKISSFLTCGADNPSALDFLEYVKAKEAADSEK